MTQEQQTDSLEKIAQEVRVCQACKLHKGRTNAVPGDGSSQAEILFIGEGPGMHEDKQGKPFVGAAGQFLNEMLASAGLNRSECFIANIVKCRPPNNRDPEADEITACSAYLNRQIALINPKIIVTLGRFSMAKYFPGETIGKIHGKARIIQDKIVLPLYHPAAALHQNALKATLLEDFKQVPAALANARKKADQEKQVKQPIVAANPETNAQKENPEIPPEQLSLF